MRSLVLVLCVVMIGCDSPRTTTGDADITPDTASGGGDIEDEPSGATPSECLSGHACELDADCPDGHRCNTALASPTCQAIHCGDVDTTCNDDALCDIDLYCSEAVQRCLAGDAGDPCATTDDCRAGLTCPTRFDTDVQTNDGMQVAWVTIEQPCIAVSYNPALEPYRETLQAALIGMVDPNCTDLCFTSPVAAEGPVGARSLHIAGTTTALSEVTFTFDDGGNLTKAVVRIPVFDGNAPSAAGLLLAVASGLALELEEGPIPSAICAWYPIMRCR